jgi:hypothetical protein
LEVAFRNLWTDNADALSILYTGTPALKTDFTRTGKRTYKGAIDDGKNSMTRYFINNFSDGYHVDCLDVATAQINVKNTTLNSRPFPSYMQMALLSLIGAMWMTSMFVAAYFP